MELFSLMKGLIIDFVNLTDVVKAGMRGDDLDYRDTANIRSV